ncbi:kelch-like protein 30 isoform X1 [Ornithorhynchus anatinus]|uniref:Kelch like family member 30 n=1 Tax=Ornithorhynchus anatinus TaxID=9258 RepID=F7DS24_ORNAN|nr:kelch-like protein 30 isoform X1 [Ornithorhynchus anatinus]XP_028924933.1 kelch-like protein 30 isoform X1 [Ornithorhynchus anatinus]
MVRNVDDLDFCLATHPQDILEGLQGLRTNPKLSDVTLLVGGREFPCHRSILALCSHYFHAMFAGDFVESISARVEIKDVDAAVVGELLDFAYTGKLTINQGNVEGLIRTANRLQFPTVLKVCCRYLQQQVDATNCLGICEFGELHGCPEVSSKARAFLQENFEDVSQEEEFLLLPKERLALCLSDDLLQVREEQSLVEAVLRWVRYQEGARARHLPDLLGLVHLVSLPDQFLQHLLSSEPLIRESEACQSVISRYRSTKENTFSVEQTLLALPQKLEEVLVVVGGRALEEAEDEESSEEPPAVSRNFAFYNAKSKCWTALPDFPDYHKWGFSLVALNNDIYVTGGSRGTQVDTWSTTQSWCFHLKEGTWKPIAPMLKPRTNHASAVLNGEIYALGGTTMDIVEVESYDPYNDCWSLITPALKYVSNFSAVGCQGKLYLIGSCACKYNALTLQCYNPVIDVWSVIASPFIPKYLSSPRCASLHGAIYLIGDNTKKVYVYDPDANLWQKVQLLHSLHENGGMVSLGGKLYVTGGRWQGMDGDYRVEMEVYDCNKDVWTREGALPCLWLYHGSSSIFMDVSKWTEPFVGTRVH